MSTRKELIAATKLRYGAGTPAEKRTILEEFVGLTGYHRKHAIRILNQTNTPTERKPRDRTYDEAVKQALVLLWEAGDRLCGKRLKVQIPILIEALERHGKLSLVYERLESDPSLNAKQIMAELAKAVPELYGTQSQLRTLQRRLKEWRNERAKKLIYGDAAAETDGHSTVAPSGATVE